MSLLSLEIFLRFSVRPRPMEGEANGNPEPAQQGFSFRRAEFWF